MYKLPNNLGHICHILWERISIQSLYTYHDEGFMRLFPVVKLSVSYAEAAVMVFCFHHLVNSILLFQMLHFSYCIGSFKPACMWVATKKFDFCHLDLASKLTKSFAAFYSLSLIVYTYVLVPSLALALKKQTVNLIISRLWNVGTSV